MLDGNLRLTQTRNELFGCAYAGDQFSLSVIQESLVREALRGNESINLICPLLFSGELNLQRLHAAFVRLLQRHSALRLHIGQTRPSGNGVGQVASSDAIYIYFCHHSDRKSLHQATLYKFGYGELPVQVHCFNADLGKHVVVIVANPIAIDRTSMRHITEELWQMYGTCDDGGCGYLDMTGPEKSDCILVEKQSPRAHIESADVTLVADSLIGDGNRRTGLGALDSSMIRINSHYHQRLKALAQQYDTSLEPLLMAAIAKLLGSIEGLTGCLLAADCGARESLNIKHAVGCYDSLFPFLIPVQPTTTLIELSGDITKLLTQRHSNVSQLQTLRDQTTSTCFSALVLTGKTRPNKPWSRKELQLETLPFGTSHLAGWKFDIAAEFVEIVEDDGRSSGILGRIEYNRDRFSYPGFVALMNAFERIIVHDCASESAALSIMDTPLTKASLSSVDLTSFASNALINNESATNPAHDKLIRIWESILGLRGITIGDRFNQLGGNDTSLKLMLKLATDEFHGMYDLTTLSISTGVTVRELVDCLAEKVVTQAVQIIKDRSGSMQSPLFFCHGEFGARGLYLWDFADCVTTNRSIVALHPHGITGNAVPSSIEEMAALHCEEIMHLQPQGPYLVAGYCNAGLVAFEIARQLRAKGCDVAFLAVIGSLYKSIPGVQSVSFSQRQGRSVGRNTLSSLFMQHSLAANQYVPGFYEGTVSCFWPADDPSPEPLDIHWGRVARKVDCYAAVGNHRTCISGEIQSLAKQINESISKAVAL